MQKTKKSISFSMFFCIFAESPNFFNEKCENHWKIVRVPNFHKKKKWFSLIFFFSRPRFLPPQAPKSSKNQKINENLRKINVFAPKSLKTLRKSIENAENLRKTMKSAKNKKNISFSMFFGVFWRFSLFFYCVLAIFFKKHCFFCFFCFFLFFHMFFVFSPKILVLLRKTNVFRQKYWFY